MNSFGLDLAQVGRISTKTLSQNYNKQLNKRISLSSRINQVIGMTQQIHENWSLYIYSHLLKVCLAQFVTIVHKVPLLFWLQFTWNLKALNNRRTLNLMTLQIILVQSRNRNTPTCKMKQLCKPSIKANNSLAQYKISFKTRNSFHRKNPTSALCKILFPGLPIRVPCK